MRFDRQFAAGIFASLIAFLAIPTFLPGLTLFGSFIILQIVVWVLAWLFLNLTYIGGGRRK